jgi:hypothetical protein
MALSLKTGLILPPSGEIRLDLHLKDYLIPSELPTPPQTFGDNNVLNGQFLGNDVYGDCAEAMACRMQCAMDLWSATPASFNTGSALEVYSQWTSFTQTDPSTGGPWPTDPSTGEPNNPTDQGTTMDQVVDGWTNTGIIDASGKYHKIVGAVDLNPGDLQQLWMATFLFGSVGMAFNLPQSAQDAVQQGGSMLWDTGGDTTIVGGHAVPNFGRKPCTKCGPTQPFLGQTESWGFPVQFTPRFFTTYNAGGVIVFSQEMLNSSGLSITGLKSAQLADDLQQVGKL